MSFSKYPEDCIFMSLCGHRRSLLCSIHRCLITPFSPISPSTCFSLLDQKIMTLQKAHEMFNVDNLCVCVCVCVHEHVCVQSCLTLFNPMDCSRPGSSVHGKTYPGKNTEAGCHFLLQGIFPAQEANLPLLCFLH